MKKIVIILIVALGFVVQSWGQNECNSEKKCNPKGKENLRTNIVDEKLTEYPYNSVVHLVTARWIGGGVGTATFIKNNVLITANHNVMYKPFISRITLSYKGKDFYFRKSDFKIYHYHQGLFHNKCKDIAIVIFKEDVSKKIGISNINVSEFDSIKNTNTKLYLTGFPCDKNGVLVDKSDSLDNFITNQKEKMVGYELYTCSGDSGASLWYEENGEFKL